MPSFPVKEVHLVLYMQHLSESTGSKAAVEEAVHALSWLHGLAGLQPLGGGGGRGGGRAVTISANHLGRFKAHIG